MQKVQKEKVQKEKELVYYRVEKGTYGWKLFSRKPKQKEEMIYENDSYNVMKKLSNLILNQEQ